MRDESVGNALCGVPRFPPLFGEGRGEGGLSKVAGTLRTAVAFSPSITCFQQIQPRLAQGYGTATLLRVYPLPTTNHFPHFSPHFAF
jgi:hypothetical protein